MKGHGETSVVRRAGGTAATIVTQNVPPVAPEGSSRMPARIAVAFGKIIHDDISAAFVVLKIVRSK
jgi:hypothetical protein